MSDTLKYGKPKGKTAEYLNRYFLSEFRTGYVTCKEVVLPEYFSLFGDRIREMDIRADDIWVCSYPKTGTTWAQEMVWCIAKDVNLKVAEELLTTRFPFLEDTPLYDFRRMKSLDTGLNEHGTDSVSFTINRPSPRFVKSHLPFKLLPENLQRNDTPAKIIYITRNVRDTCISYYHHSRNLENFRGGFEEFCELFMEGNVCYGQFIDHVAGFWEQRNNPNILIIKYEDMKQDLKSVIHIIAAFLGKTLDEEQEEKLLDHLSFQNMKNNPAVNLQATIDFYKKFNIIEANEPFMRRGKIGGWKDTMSPEMLKRFEKWEEDYLKKMEPSTDFLNLIY